MSNPCLWKDNLFAISVHIVLVGMSNQRAAKRRLDFPSTSPNLSLQSSTTAGKGHPPQLFVSHQHLEATSTQPRSKKGHAKAHNNKIRKTHSDAGSVPQYASVPKQEDYSLHPFASVPTTVPNAPQSRGNLTPQKEGSRDHWAGGAHMNSPAPHSLPLPDFDDEWEESDEEEGKDNGRKNKLGESPSRGERLSSPYGGLVDSSSQGLYGSGSYLGISEEQGDDLRSSSEQMTAELRQILKM